MSKTDAPNFYRLVQNVVNAAHEEGRQDAMRTNSMQTYYDMTHKAVYALFAAIATIKPENPHA